MKIHAILKNERGGKKATSDDTRILVELSYKNTVLGTVGLYTIGNDEGVRIVWDEAGKGYPNQIILERETGKKQNDKCGCAYCNGGDHSTCHW